VCSGATDYYSGNVGLTPEFGLITLASAVNNLRVAGWQVQQSNTGQTYTQTIASGNAVLGTSAIASGSCATTVTVSATGVAAGDKINADFNVSPTSISGYGVSGSGAVLSVYKWATTAAVNFGVCNSSSSSITPGAATLNWSVTR
jgi:hypothetical protein